MTVTQGWIECVGHANRAAYDLESHSKASGEDLTAVETLVEPQVVDVCEIEANVALIGKTFRGEQKTVVRQTLYRYTHVVPPVVVHHCIHCPFVILLEILVG